MNSVIGPEQAAVWTQARERLNMKYVEIVADVHSADTVSAIAEKLEVSDVRPGIAGEDGMRAMRLLVADDKIQSVLDSLQKVLDTQPSARIVVLPVEIALPKPSEKERKEEDAANAAREALYEGVEKNARLDINLQFDTSNDVYLIQLIDLK